MISTKKQKNMSNIDENILQVSSNNIISHHGSSSLNKNNFSYQLPNNNNNYINNKNNNINNFTNNILNNLSNLENLIHSPKESKDTLSNFLNPNIKKLNLSNPNLLSNGSNTTTNKTYFNNLFIEPPDSYNNILSPNSTISNLTQIKQQNVIHIFYIFNIIFLYLD